MFIPIVGKDLTIALPGEMLRATVLKAVTPDAIIVQISTEPLARLSHNYKNGQVIACRRKRGMFGEEWEAVQQTFASVEDLERQEKDNAAREREQREREIKQHPRTDGHRKISPKAGGGNRVKPSKTPPKKERRNRGVR